MKKGKQAYVKGKVAIQKAADPGSVVRDSEYSRMRTPMQKNIVGRRLGGKR